MLARRARPRDHGRMRVFVFPSTPASFRSHVDLLGSVDEYQDATPIQMTDRSMMGQHFREGDEVHYLWGCGRMNPQADLIERRIALAKFTWVPRQRFASSIMPIMPAGNVPIFMSSTPGHLPGPRLTDREALEAWLDA